MKLFKAVAKLYLYHLMMVFIAVFLIVPLWALLEHLPLCFTLVTGFLYCACMYSTGWNFGKQDSRKIPGYYPNRLFPVKAGLLGMILPVALLIFRFAAPGAWPMSWPVTGGEMDFLFPGNLVHGTPDLLYKLWYFPLEAFVGNSNPFTYALMILVQPVVFTVGYQVGLTRFRMLDTLLGRLVYKKKIEQQNQKSPWNK